MWVALSHAAMHSGMVLPVAPPPVIADPPLVAITSPVFVVCNGPIAALVGLTIAELVLAPTLGSTTLFTPKAWELTVDVRFVVDVALVVVVSVVGSGILPVVDRLGSGSVARSCAPGLS
jgi:hypothetical protein